MNVKVSFSECWSEGQQESLVWLKLKIVYWSFLRGFIVSSFKYVFRGGMGEF